MSVATGASVEEFLFHEAELLDERRLREWLGLLTEDVRYQVPVRTAREQGAEPGVTGIATDMFHLDEDYASLELRVERVETGFAWAEDPPSRLRHFVANVRTSAVPERDDELAVRSNVLVWRSRWDRPEHDLLSGERRDVLRLVAGEWRLARRLVVLDSTTLPTLNLAFFF
ncbi:MAG TPA: 3-phenylpropionate/cinnamic acid dioxygenase subunit beta [Gaiellaceae bacterium]|nr:3-phenylpropionate/cinnamic acid dioxygenase subunit beta [Gaiellaceae bacterium]